MAPGAPQLTERGGRLEPEVRLGRPRREELREDRRGRRGIEVGQRSCRLDAHDRHVALVTEHGEERRDAARFLDSAEAARRKRAGHRPLAPEQVEQHRPGLRAANSAERVGDGPPSTDRRAAPVQQRARERRIRAQSHERIHPQPHCFDVWRFRMFEVVRRNARQRARGDERRHHRGDGIRRGLVADQPEPFGRASLNERLRILQRRHQRVGGTRLTEQAERKRSHLPHLGILIPG